MAGACFRAYAIRSSTARRAQDSVHAIRQTSLGIGPAPIFLLTTAHCITCLSRGQNISFTDSWTWRGLLACRLTTPKLLWSTRVAGGSNCTRLNVLKNSARNCALNRSPLNELFLKNDRLKFFTPSARRLGITRGVLPHVKAGVMENADVSNHFLTLSSALPLRFASLPFHVGRCVGLNRPTLFAPCVMMSGKPL